jgi:eukaryotic-like serine/threonine-protein kinase
VGEAGRKLREALGAGEVAPIDVGSVRAAFPANPLAAQLYSEGLSRLRVFDALGARTLLEQAAAAEPNHPLIRAALARVWSALGYDAKAKAESQQALDQSKDLSREDRLAVQGLHYETTGDWPRAIEAYAALLVFFPDRLDYGLQLAAAQTSGGRGKDALETIASLRRLPAPASLDPRIDLAEAAAAKALTDFPRQQRAAQAAAAQARRQGATLVLGQAVLAEGTALVNSGKLEEGRKACEEAGEIFAAAGDRGSVARAENVIAVAYARAGDMASARTRFRQSLEAFRRIGDKRGTAAQLGNVAMAEKGLGNAAEAKRLNAEALEVAREIGDPSGVARTLNNLALCHEALADLEAARRTFEEAIAAYRELGETRNAALAMSNLGEVLHKQKKLDAAREQFNASLQLGREAGAGADTAVTLTLLAEIQAEQGDLVGAQVSLEEAVSRFRAEGDQDGEAGALRRQAGILELRGDKPGARALVEQADRIDKARKPPR